MNSVPVTSQNVPMAFPIALPIKPMLAKLARTIPEGDHWLFEPKWDGFRCIVAREGDSVELHSRSERPFTRYFPELLPVLRAALPDHVVIDGEIVVPDHDGKGLDFDALLQRIHPAASRVNRLAEETPAVFIAFDVLAVGDDSWLERPLRDRRDALLDLVKPGPSVFITPASSDPAVAADWFTTFEGAGLDGIVAKGLDDVYQPDKRALVKVKHQRTADCVLAGFRMHKDGQGVGSMLLGLFDDSGTLHHVGVAAAFSVSERKELLAELTPMRENALDGHPWAEWAEFAQLSEPTGPGEVQRRPGATSRWNAGKDLSWVPVRVERVVEVTFGQLENGRFRHGVTFLRWRPDRTPESCRYDQLDVASPVDFHEFMATSAGG
jgi:ATP-dependent DNA ligase